LAGPRGKSVPKMRNDWEKTVRMCEQIKHHAHAEKLEEREARKNAKRRLTEQNAGRGHSWFRISIQSPGEASC